MKKLCTYLTLLVLALLCFAQPAAAANFQQGRVYYIDISNVYKDNSSFSYYPDNSKVLLYEKYNNDTNWNQIRELSSKDEEKPLVFSVKPTGTNVEAYIIQISNSSNGNDVWHETWIVPDGNNTSLNYCTVTEMVNFGSDNWGRGKSGSTKYSWGNPNKLYITGQYENGKNWNTFYDFPATGDHFSCHVDANKEFKLSLINAYDGEITVDATQSLSDVHQSLYAKRNGGNFKPSSAGTLFVNGDVTELWFVADGSTVDPDPDPTPGEFIPGKENIVYISGELNGNGEGHMSYAGNGIYYFQYTTGNGNTNFTIWYGGADKKNTASYRLGRSDGAGFTFPVSPAKETGLKWGAQNLNSLYVKSSTGFIVFDAINMTGWWQSTAPTGESGNNPGTDDTSTWYIKGRTPATTIYYKGNFPGGSNSSWGSFQAMTPTDKEGEWKIERKGGNASTWYEFILSTSNGDNAETDNVVIAPITTTSDMGSVSGMHQALVGRQNTINVNRHHKPENNFTFQGNGTIYFDQKMGEVWFEPTYEQKSGSLFIIGDPVGGWNEGLGGNWTEMPKDKDGKYYWEFKAGGQFKLSTTNSGWNNTVAPEDNDDGSNSNPHHIYKGDGEAASSSNGTKDNLCVKGSCVLHVEAKSDGTYWIWITGLEDGNYYIYGRFNEFKPVKMAPDKANVYRYGPIEGGEYMVNDFLISDVFDTNNEFYYENDHVFAPVQNLQVPNGEGNAMSVNRYGKNGEHQNFYLPEKGTVYINVATKKIWYEKYEEVEGALYILDSSMGNDWGSGQPVRMNYDEKTGLHSYHLNGSTTFGISRKSSNYNYDFWTNNYMLRARTGYNEKGGHQISQYRYPHFVEPDEYNLENGAWNDGNGHNFTTYKAAGTIYVRYDAVKGQGKIWYTPDNWADVDLYITGAIIANKEATQVAEESNEGTSQWNVVAKMTPFDVKDNPGLYYYWLGLKGKGDNDDEIWSIDEDALFNLNKYIAKKNKDGDRENEIGHFNFSFNVTNPSAATGNSGFWSDPFVPQGRGMGNLDRNGTPFPYVYRESEPARDDNEGNWTSTNFVFKERCRVWVDAIRQLVWVELRDTKLSDEAVMFTFWDKRGDAYPVADYDYLRWWGTGDIEKEKSYAVELYAVDKSGEEIGTQALSTVDGAWTLSFHSIDGVTDGVYHGITSAVNQGLLDAVKNEYGQDAKVKDYLWVRIKNVTNTKIGDKEIIRPYVDNAIYTQVLNSSDPANNVFDDITEDEMKLTVTSDIRVINNATPAERMTGGFTADEAVVYPSVNQYQTVLTFNDPINFKDENDSALFEKTYSVTGYIGNKEFNAYDEAAKQNQIIITGVNPLDGELDRFDKVFINLDYKSNGMMFTRSYERPLQVQDDDELKDAFEKGIPVMNHTEAEGEVAGEAIAFLGAPEYVDENGELKTEGHCALDLVLHKTFKFREEMIKTRAAYIRYKITGMRIKRQNDSKFTPYEGECMMVGKNLPESEVHVATNGRPVSWDFGDDKVNKFGELWYQEAFVNKQLDIQLSHVLCAESPEAIQKLNMEFEVDVEYELIVPFADEIAAYFEAPEPGSAFQVKRRAGEGGGEESEELTAAPVDTTVPGYDNEEGYKSTLSAPEGNEYKDTHTFAYKTGEFMIPTGVENISVAEKEEGEVEYFNLQGMRVNADNLTPGLYIRRQGDASSKIYIR